MIYRLLKNTNPLITGIFLLIWATDAYFIMGNLGKYLSLLIGFLLLIVVLFNERITKKALRFILIATVFYGIFLLIAFLKEQKTTTPQQLTFGFVCYTLLIVGYFLGKNPKVYHSITSKQVIFYSILIIIGVYAFYKQQSVLFVNYNSRDLGDETLNPIGVAYTHALLLLFVTWMYFQTNKKLLRLLVLLSGLASLIVILFTVSKGVIIFLFTIFLLYLFKGNNLSVKNFFTYLKTITVVVLVLTFIFVLLKKDPIIAEKIDSLINRFEVLLGYIDHSSADASSDERMYFYKMFKKNIANFILGEYQYDPYPHNQFIEIFMRWGIFGIPLLLFSVIMFLKSIMIMNKKRYINTPLLFLMSVLFIFSFLQSLTSMSLEMNRFLWMGFGFFNALKTSKV